MEQQAFVLRISPSGIDRVPEALSSNQIIIGWALADGLLDPSLSWEEFREIIRKTYYENEENLRKPGGAAGHMWRFIREMSVGDLVVVPYWSDFYVAKVEGSASYDESRTGEDTAYRRDVQWLNDKKPIPRSLARSALVSRMKTQGTCASATDLLQHVRECLDLSASNQRPTFQDDLQLRLVRETVEELRSGRMDPFGFERLISDVLLGLGAKNARIVARNQDKGAGILATFLVAGAFQQIVAVQAKHWQPEPPVGREQVEQLIRGIEAESANLGMIVTSGSIADDAALLAEQYYEEKGIRIELIDGEQFAKLMVEHGIQKS